MGKFSRLVIACFVLGLGLYFYVRQSGNTAVAEAVDDALPVDIIDSDEDMGSSENASTVEGDLDTPTPDENGIPDDEGSEDQSEETSDEQISEDMDTSEPLSEDAVADEAPAATDDENRQDEAAENIAPAEESTERSVDTEEASIILSTDNGVDTNDLDSRWSHEGDE